MDADFYDFVAGRVIPARSMARRLVEGMALALQAGLLVRHAPAPVADAFCGRLADGRRAFGTLPAGTDAEAILERALVV